MMEDTIHQLQTAQLSAEAASGIIREYRSGEKQFKKHIKSSETDFATTADLECEAIITALIQAEFPQDTIISEETAAGVPLSEHTWIIDPIDGTYNFANNSDMCGPMIARSNGNELELAAAHMPLAQIEMHAATGAGAFINGEQVHVDQITTGEAFDPTRIHFGWLPTSSITVDTIIDSTLLQDATVGIAKRDSIAEYDHGNKSAIGMIYAMLTGKMMAVVGGGFIWDIAPAFAILQEAGFDIKSIGGEPANWRNGAQIMAISRPEHTEKLHAFLQAG